MKDGYIGLRERLKLQLKEQAGVVPLDFLIGCNRYGKSSVWRRGGTLFLPVLCKMRCQDLFLN